MTRFARSVIAVLFMLSAAVVRAEDAPLVRGTAIIDPLALRELDSGRFSLRSVLAPTMSVNSPMSNQELFALPSMAPVRKALDAEFSRYIARHNAELPNETIGVGPSFDFELFDRTALDSVHARFVLSGIVNRMDRAYLAPNACGEIRLIYRLTQIGAAEIGQAAVSPRLPMTLNLVLKAKGDAPFLGGAPISCPEIARRWLATADLKLTGKELAAKLTDKGGALDLIPAKEVKRIEINLQIAHAPKSALRDFRTDYLMKVFDYDAQSQTFDEVPLENQIDRERLLADKELQRDFKAWLLDPAHLSEFDRGTVLIPQKFLATRAIAPTPVGFAPSDPQPAFGLVAGEASAQNPLFNENDVLGALEKAAGRGIELQNVRSVAGFQRRLNDMTCAGCHQTRGIGGFHFPGVDWMAAKPSNTIVVPGSPQFFGDQVRRRDILTAFRDGRKVDFSRGFSSRPQLRGSTELAGSQYEDGWGAHCYVRHDKESENDLSFRSWTCAEGLACQAMSPASRIGMCFVNSR